MTSGAGLHGCWALLVRIVQGRCWLCGAAHLVPTAAAAPAVHLPPAPLGRVFVPPAGEPFELVDVEAEVTLLGGAEEEPLKVRGEARAEGKHGFVVCSSPIPGKAGWLRWLGVAQPNWR